MTVLYDPNPNPTGKWGWWGDPNVTDEMIVDYQIRNPGFPTKPRGPVWGEPGHEPWQRFPEPFDPTLPLPNPTPRQVDPREVFDPFVFPDGLAGRYMGMGGGPIWAGALGGLIGAGINLFARKGKRK